MNVPLDPPGEVPPAPASADPVTPAEMPVEERAEATTPVDRPVRPADRARPVHLALLLVAVLGGSVLFVSGYALGARVATTPGTPVSDASLFASFWETYHSITRLYVGAVDRKALVEGAIDGMIKSLDDPFSAYMSSEDFRRSLQTISGQTEGIGVSVVTTRPDGTAVDCSPLGPDCRLTIAETVEGAPAEKAGLRANDVIVAVDGTPVDGRTRDEATAGIRGRKGTPVTVTVERAGQPPFDTTIVRDVITQKEVSTRVLGDGAVAYVKLRGFSDGSAPELATVLHDHQAAGRKAVILDLRDNGGGLVTAARAVASQFIASGPIYWQETSNGNKVAIKALEGGQATDPSLRVVVLINGGSASASEIVAGALQDTGRATLVGERSYGKGTIQEWQTLPNDTGGFRLSIAKWLTPRERWIHGTGLTPDVEAPVPSTAVVGTDPVLDRALEVLGAPTGLARPVRVDA